MSAGNAFTWPDASGWDSLRCRGGR